MMALVCASCCSASSIPANALLLSVPRKIREAVAGLEPCNCCNCADCCGWSVFTVGVGGLGGGLSIRCATAGGGRGVGGLEIK